MIESALYVTRRVQEVEVDIIRVHGLCPLCLFIRAVGVSGLSTTTIVKRRFSLTEYSTREDSNKVPQDFPELLCRSRIYSDGRKCLQPYYKAKDVWKWFKRNKRENIE